MAGLLLSGPAGAGKTQIARGVVASSAIPALLIDFQGFYAAVLGIQRDPETGRYPEREESDEYALPVAEYMRRSAITVALSNELFAVVTNSDGDSERRSFLLGLLGADASERVVDPGLEVVRGRLSVEGVLSDQCGDAIDRWYTRI